MHGFLISGCTITLRSIEFVDSPCGGSFCDYQSLMNNEVMANRCCCFQAMNRLGSVVVLMDIDIKTPGENGSVFSARFVSKWFMMQYILTRPFPPGTNAFQFEDFIIEDRVFNSIRNQFNYFNGIGGITVIGWVKRGEVEDQGVDQPNNGLPHHAQRVTVQAGTLTYHITRLDPTSPGRVDHTTLNGHKFDPYTGLVGGQP